jgi:signal transduction histidine kinase
LSLSRLFHRAACCSAFLLGQILGTAGSAGEGGVWRWFGPAQGLPNSPTVALSVGPKGVLWARHGQGGGVSALDGYSVRQIPAPSTIDEAVYENRTGQLWAMERQGVLEFRRDAWFLHVVEAVRDRFRADPQMPISAVRLLPAERNRLLLQLPEVLIKHDVLQGTTDHLVTAEDLGIGELFDLIEAQDGQIWVVGRIGLAWASGPVRQLDRETRWEVVPLPRREGQTLRFQSRVFERPEGGLVAVGESAGDGMLVALVYDGLEWRDPIPLPEGAQRVWAGQGNSLWCYTRQALYAWQSGSWAQVNTPGLEKLDLLDVAVEPGGEFWLATAQGLVRRAEALWQTPAGLPLETGPLSSIIEMPDGSLWFGGSERLLVRRGDTWNVVAPPQDLSGGVDGPIHRHGSLLVFKDTAGKLAMVDERGEQWRVLTAAAGWRVERLLGVRTDGRLVVQTTAVDGENGWRLETFDGRGLEFWWQPPQDWRLGGLLHFAAVSRAGLNWLGSERGLATWNERSGAFLPVEGYAFGPALSLVDVGDVRVWCSNGSMIFEGDGRAWTSLRPSPGPVERLVALRDGTIWGLGASQAARFLSGAWMRHGEEEGLPPAGVRDLHLDARGRLWAATDEGVRRHFPDADTEPPRTHVTSVGGRRQFTTRERAALVLRGADRWSYALADRLLFSTRLNEGTWSAYSLGSVLVLSNLTAGQHRLEVRSMDPALNEEPEPAVFEFVAFVPWYGEPRIVAVGLAGLTVALLLAVLAVNRHFRLLRSYAEVERIVDERTHELERANAELVHSQKMRALGTLAAGIAHDFNSLLSIIKGSAQIIEDCVTDADKVRTRVDRIKKMVDQGAGIVKAMLGLSRTSREDWRVTDLGALLEETARMVADQLPKQVIMHIEREPNLPPVRLVGDLFRQLLFNLISNATESMSGRGEILLRARRGEASGALVVPPVARGLQVVVEVLDTGHGIAPEALPRIFEPFFTTKAFSTRRGTGLGLTMVYEIARELGLGLGVESTPGHGSMFRIFVPVNRQLPGDPPVTPQ